MDDSNEPSNGNEEKALRDLEHAEADLKRAEGEVNAAEKELEEARRHHELTIVVDGVDHRLHRRKWIVSELKAKLGIEPAKVLARITPNGLVDLDDNAEIELHDGEQFMTHARSGGSS